MKRVRKWTGMAVAGLVGVLVLAAGFVYVRSEARLNRSWQVSPAPAAMVAPAFAGSGGHGGEGNGEGNRAEEHGNGGGAVDFRSEILAWGEHLAVTRGCADCHGPDLGGSVFVDAMPVMRLIGSNLTRAGIGAAYSDADWVRAVRHGIGPDGKGLLFMPSQEYYSMSDQDLAALIAYLKSVPAVARDLPASAVGPVGRALLVAGKLPLLSAEMIDHEGPRPTAPPKGATVAYGEYLAVGCTGCHGPGFSGGPIPGAPPEFPPAANITPDPATGVGGWTREQFLAALTQGKRPDGRQIEPHFMPWPNFARFQPDEQEALWMYLSRVQARPFGGR